MPVHKIPAASLHEDLIDIKRQGEIVEQVVRVNRREFVVITRKPDLIEKRPAMYDLTHASRVGAMELRAEWDAFLTDDIVRLDGDA